MKDPSGHFERSSELLGRGAFKEVYKAFDTERGIEVAWNQLALGSLSEKSAEKILEEIRILQTLDHENIITFFHSWCTPDPNDPSNFHVIFITELMTSGTLKSYIKKCTPPPIKLKVIKNWAKQILEGLNYMHTRTPPIIHRDLKCDNVFINGNNGQAKIGDLGLATIKRKDLECIPTSGALGTPEFMAPELYDEHYNEKVDIYSFGMCILELVTLDYPYSECENAAQIYRKVTNGIKPASLATIQDDQVREFIEICIQKDYTSRPSAAELLRHAFLSLSSDQQQQHHHSLPIEIAIISHEFPIIQLEMSLGAKQIKFPFNLQNEHPSQVASEMVKHELIPPSAAASVCEALKSTVGKARDFFLKESHAKTVSHSPSLCSSSAASLSSLAKLSIIDADFSSQSSWEALNLNTAPPLRLESASNPSPSGSASIEFLQQLELEMFAASSSPQISTIPSSSSSSSSSSLSISDSLIDFCEESSSHSCCSFNIIPPSCCYQQSHEVRSILDEDEEEEEENFSQPNESVDDYSGGEVRKNS